jgi:hypothetical protein
VEKLSLLVAGGVQSEISSYRSVWESKPGFDDEFGSGPLSRAWLATDLVSFD